MVAKENPEVIEVRRRLIAVDMDVIDSEEESDYASIVHDYYDLDEEDGDRTK